MTDDRTAGPSSDSPPGSRADPSDRPDGADAFLSRRRLLRASGRSIAVGSLLASETAGVGAAAEDGGDGENGSDDGGGARALDVAVATQNLGLGADFLSLARGEDAPIPERVGELYADVRDSRPRDRMAAVADSLAREGPEILAVQEAAIVRRGPRSGGNPTSPDAETVAVDFLANLREELTARGVPYRPAAIATNADLEFPGRVDGDRIDVRLTDRDAVLVREDADASVLAGSSGTFDASLTLPIGGGRTVEVERGYATADLRVDGERLTAVSSHLESALSRVRRKQAVELAAAVAELDAPIVVLGDLNDGPDALPEGEGDAGEANDAPEGAYEVLTAGLSDAVADARGDGAPGEVPTATCCRPSSLRPPDAEGLTRRIDHVLVDGLRATGARRIGVDAFAGTAADGQEGELWPSDHAGVCADLTSAAAEATPAAHATRTSDGSGAPASAEPTASGGSPSPTPTATTSTGTPGFGASTGAAALGVAVGAAVLRRLRRGP